MIDKDDDIVIHPWVYVICSPNIARTEYYFTYSKVLERLKDYEHLEPADGSEGSITIEYQRNVQFRRDFDEDTQSIRGADRT